MNPIKSLLILFLFLFPFLTFAWNIPGHMVTGAIAYRELKRKDPKAVSRVIALLQKHPLYDQMFAPRLDESLTQEEKDLYLFMLAARWPDDIKGTSYEPKHHNWHYINYPYTKPGSVVELPLPDSVDIVTAYRHNLQLLKSKVSEAEKATALCWVFHLIGDVHQPLHTAALYSELLPNGDKGGNLLFVKAEEEGKSFTLHSFWDWLVIGSQGFREADNRAVLLKNQQSYSRKNLKELKYKKFGHWAEEESFELAKKYVYTEEGLPESTGRETALLLSKHYIDSAKAVAEQQIVLAGYRIAELLGKLY